MEDNETIHFFQETQKSEKALIGAILLDNQLMDLALEHLQPGNFITPMNSAVFAAMVELSKNQRKLSPASVLQELRTHGDLPDAGGEVYVQSLRNSVPSSLTRKRTDYINRFAVVAVSLAIQSAAFNEMDMEEIGKLISTKFTSLRKLIRQNSPGKSFP